MWVHPRTSGTPTDALPRVPEITDTEEVTGSNPVSPTSNIPSEMSFSRVCVARRATQLATNKQIGPALMIN
jgi:hypothetical protein